MLRVTLCMYGRTTNSILTTYRITPAICDTNNFLPFALPCLYSRFFHLCPWSRSSRLRTSEQPVDIRGAAAAAAATFLRV